MNQSNNPKIKLKELTKPNWLKVENAEQIKAMRDFCIKSNQIIWTEYLERDCNGLIYPVYFQYKNDHIGERFLVTNWDKKYITHDQVIYEFNQLETNP